MSIKSKKTTRKRRAKSRKPKKAFFTPKIETKAPKIERFSKDFNKLQDEWYQKLADEGFKDLERPVYSADDDGGLLKGASLKNFADNFSPETRHFYARLRCFLTFNPQIADGYGGFIGPTKRAALEMLAEGMPFRKILEALKGRPGPALNLFSLSKLYNHFVALAEHWNKVNFNGLDFEPDIGPR